MVTTSAPKPTAGAFGRAAVAALCRRTAAPDWLREARLAAWERADAMPPPAPWERAWKYFKPEHLRFEGLQPAVETEDTAGQIQAGALPCVADAANPALDIQNGVVLREQIDALSSERGVIFCSLERAAREHPELVGRHLGTVVPDGESVYVALNAALWSGGAFVYVPRDVKVELPLHLTQTLAGAGHALFPRTLIVVDRGAEVTFLDERAGGDGPGYVGGITELVLRDEAKARFYVAQRWGTEVQELFYQRAELGRNAELLTLFGATGGRVSKGWIEARIRGAGARSEILGAIFGTGDQYFDLVTTQDHIGDHTVSDLLIKSALRDRAHAAYYGLTRVGRAARMSDANQENRNLLLSDRAKADAEPVLEILTSEVVRCAHGASAGPVDPEQLFYLECRGLPRPAAERLLVQGFLGGVLARVPSESVRDMVEQAVLARLG